MTKRMVLMATVSFVAAMAVISCRRSDTRTAVIDVPQMSDAMAIRIVTNATLDEVVGQYDGVKNDFEVDLSRKLVVYHEGQRLMSRDYHRRLVDRIAEVGYSAQVISARFDPPTLVPTRDGPYQMWPDRHTAIISVPDMESKTDANIVVDAIAFARLGRDDPRIEVDASRGRVVASYESIRLSLKSIEHAIASAGFDANRVPAKLGHPDAPAHGWKPVRL